MRLASIVCMSSRTAAAPVESSAGCSDPAAIRVRPSLSTGLSPDISVSLPARRSAAATSTASCDGSVAMRRRTWEMPKWT